MDSMSPRSRCRCATAFIIIKSSGAGNGTRIPATLTRNARATVSSSNGKAPNTISASMPLGPCVTNRTRALCANAKASFRRGRKPCRFPSLRNSFQRSSETSTRASTSSSPEDDRGARRRLRQSQHRKRAQPVTRQQGRLTRRGAGQGVPFSYARRRAFLSRFHRVRTSDVPCASGSVQPNWFTEVISAANCQNLRLMAVARNSLRSALLTATHRVLNAAAPAFVSRVFIRRDYSTLAPPTHAAYV